MSTIGDRISVLIDSIDGLNKSKFAKRVGIAPAYVSQICSGVRFPSDRTIADICREFRVNEEWLRTGEGTMFLPDSRSDLIASFMAEVMGASSDDIRQLIVSGLAKLDVEDWEAIRDIFKKMGLI